MPQSSVTAQTRASCRFGERGSAAAQAHSSSLSSGKRRRDAHGPARTGPILARRVSPCPATPRPCGTGRTGRRCGPGHRSSRRRSWSRRSGRRPGARARRSPRGACTNPGLGEDVAVALGGFAGHDDAPLVSSGGADASTATTTRIRSGTCRDGPAGVEPVALPQCALDVVKELALEFLAAEPGSLVPAPELGQGRRAQVVGVFPGAVAGDVQLPSVRPRRSRIRAVGWSSPAPRPVHRRVQRARRGPRLGDRRRRARAPAGQRQPDVRPRWLSPPSHHQACRAAESPRPRQRGQTDRRPRHRDRPSRLNPRITLRGRIMTVLTCRRSPSDRPPLDTDRAVGAPAGLAIPHGR